MKALAGKRRVAALAAAGIVAIVGTGVATGAVGSDRVLEGGANTLGCDVTGRLVGHTVVFCGPAAARLSAFSGAVFKGGSCRKTTVAGVPQFMVKLGMRTQNARTNDGRAYFGLIVTGPLSSPSGGGVIAYWKGKRWGGVGVSFRGSARAGSFVASGINGSRGHATGSYRC